GAAAADRDPAPAAEGALAVAVGDHPPAFFGRRDFGEAEADFAFLSRGHAVEHRDIGLLDPLLLEGALEAFVGLGVAGEEQAAGRVAVEPGDRRRRGLEAEGRVLRGILQASCGTLAG